ncbi:MAG TPA: hypothetical protein VFH47_08890 [Candidatus Thermoplasmatota archaeon]|nr:hypothetical protein [Candidatus Thermoplasmatota archaeon]
MVNRAASMRPGARPAAYTLDLDFILETCAPVLERTLDQVRLVAEEAPLTPTLNDSITSWLIHARELVRLQETWRTNGYPAPKYAMLLMAEMLEHGRRGLVLLGQAAALEAGSSDNRAA